MKSSRKANANAKLKNLPAADQETMWLMLHPTDADTKPATLEEVGVYAMQRYDFDTLSSSTVSEWHSWYRVNAEFESAASLTEQVKELLRKDPNLTEEDVDRAGRMVFKNRALKEGDPKLFAEMTKLKQKDRDQDIHSRRVAILEEKERRLDEMEAKAKELKSGGGLTDEMLEMLEKQLKLL